MLANVDDLQVFDGASLGLTSREGYFRGAAVVALRLPWSGCPVMCRKELALKSS